MQTIVIESDTDSIPRRLRRGIELRRLGDWTALLKKSFLNERPPRPAALRSRIRSNFKKQREATQILKSQRGWT